MNPPRRMPGSGCRASHVITSRLAYRTAARGASSAQGLVTNRDGRVQVVWQVSPVVPAGPGWSGDGSGQVSWVAVSGSLYDAFPAGRGGLGGADGAVELLEFGCCGEDVQSVLLGEDEPSVAVPDRVRDDPGVPAADVVEARDISPWPYVARRCVDQGGEQLRGAGAGLREAGLDGREDGGDD